MFKQPNLMKNQGAGWFLVVFFCCRILLPDWISCSDIPDSNEINSFYISSTSICSFLIIVIFSYYETNTYH